jgi:YggT family protein
MVYTVYQALGYFKEFLVIMIVLRCILSWLPVGWNNPIVQFTARLSDPIVSPIRSLVYKSPLGNARMVIDVSPVIALFLLEGVYQLIGRLMGI